MSDSVANEQLNHVLIRLLRNLSQYAVESWVWSSESQAAERSVVGRIVAEQQRSVGRLADLLATRACNIEFGTYPTEYTDLHYVSLDFLRDQLIADQTGLIGELEQCQRTLSGDSEASALLTEIATEEHQHLQQLRESGVKAAA
jgi:hypothetical protein